MTSNSPSADLRHFQDQTHTPRSFRLTYVASPYSSQDPDLQEARARAAIQVTGSLIAAGEPAYSPVIYTSTILAAGHKPPKGWYEFDVNFLAAATDMLVVHMPGWRDSRGMLLETAFAKARQIPIRHMHWTTVQQLLDEATLEALLRHHQPTDAP